MRQDALAHQAGIGRTTLQQIEGGKSNPRASTLRAIAGALGVPVTSLLADDWSHTGGGGSGGGEGS